MSHARRLIKVSNPLNIKLELATSFFMLAARMQTSLVPLVFIMIASLRGSSNLTLAAAWNTTETLSIRTLRSIVGNPNPSSHTSPVTGINFLKADGFSSLSFSNSFQKKRKRDSKSIRIHRLNRNDFIAIAVMGLNDLFPNLRFFLANTEKKIV